MERLVETQYAFREALFKYCNTPVAAHLPTSTQLMIGHRLISDLLNVYIYDKDEKISEERYQQKKEVTQDPRVLPTHYMSQFSCRIL